MVHRRRTNAAHGAAAAAAAGAVRAAGAAGAVRAALQSLCTRFRSGEGAGGWHVVMGVNWWHQVGRGLLLRTRRRAMQGVIGPSAAASQGAVTLTCLG